MAVDPAAHDPFLDAASRDLFAAFSEALHRRAAEGWRIRSVTTASSPGRLEVVRRRIEILDGPDVVVRGYPVSSMPPVLNLLVVGGVDVFLAADHLRFERPASAVHLRNPAVGAWATQVSADQFDNAPIVLRDHAGPHLERLDLLSAS